MAELIPDGLDRLREQQEAEMDEKTYRVVHRATREEHIIDAASADQACRKCGWMIGDCWVQVVRRK